MTNNKCLAYSWADKEVGGLEKLGEGKTWSKHIGWKYFNYKTNKNKNKCSRQINISIFFKLSKPWEILLRSESGR